MEVKMEMRGSFDYAVFTMDNSQAVRERIWKQFAGVFKTFDAFDAAFMELTKDYRVMVLDLRARSYNIEDCVFWYRADPNLGRFKMGHPDVWIQRPLGETTNLPRPGQIILLDDSSTKQKKKITKKSMRKKKNLISKTLSRV